MENKPKFDKIKYDNEYNRQNYDSLRIVTKKGNKATIQEYCNLNDISLNKLVNSLLKQKLTNNGFDWLE